MNACTSKNCKWIAMILWPFKAYVVGLIPFYFLFRLFYPHPLRAYVGNNTTVTDPLVDTLLWVFISCAPVLLLGAVIQFFTKDIKAGICTLIFSVAPTLVLAAVLFVWVIAHLL
jgi:membrane protein DedA with SNARE-associated domain